MHKIDGNNLTPKAARILSTLSWNYLTTLSFGYGKSPSNQGREIVWVIRVVDISPEQDFPALDRSG